MLQDSCFGLPAPQPQGKPAWQLRVSNDALTRVRDSLRSGLADRQLMFNMLFRKHRDDLVGDIAFGTWQASQPAMTSGSAHSGPPLIKPRFLRKRDHLTTAGKYISDDVNLNPTLLLLATALLAYCSCI